MSIICENYKTKFYGFILTMFLTFLICFLGFQKYIFDSYIWFGASYDMTIQILPTMIEMHYQIYDGNSVMWSFYQGMGANIFTGNPNMHGDIFAWLLALLPVEMIPKSIIYIHLLKFILAAGFFFIYLCEFKTLSLYTRVIGALFYACSGVMLCRGAWWHYATEVVMLVPFLIGLEKWYRNRKSMFVIIAFAALLISRYVTYLYVYSLYSFGYLLLRNAFDSKVSVSNCLSIIKSFLPYYAAGVALASLFLMPGLFNFFTSARSENLLREGILRVFYFENAAAINANLLKFFQPNITGVITTGIQNSLEDLCGYSGVLILLVCISSFRAETKNKFFKTILAVIVLYFVWNFPQFMLNAFLVKGIKTSSIWLNVSLILMGVYFIEKKIFKIKINTSIAVIVIFVVLAYAYQWQCGLIIMEEVYWGIILLIAYSMLLFYLQKNFNNGLKLLLVALVFLECCVSVRFSSQQMNDITYYSQYDVWQKTYYRNIPRQNPDDFYRLAMVNENWMLVCDASISRYFGFDRYNSINNVAAINFTDTFFTEYNMSKSHFVLGLDRYRGIRNMLSAAYIGDARTNTFIKNEDFVPLGYLYDLQISEGELKNYPVNIRDDIFSKAAILDTPVDSINNYEDFYSVNKLQEQSLSIVDTNCLQNEAGADTHVITGDDPFIIYAVNNVKASGEEIISLEPDITVFNKESKQIQDLPVQIFYAGEDRIFSEENSFYSSIRNGQLQIYLSDDINASNVKFIRIDLGSKEQRLGIGDVRLCTYKVSLKTAAPQQEYIPYVPLNRNSVCQQESFSDTEIHLRATTDAPKVLFLSIPYDKGWSIYDNGKELDVMHVNIGFIGAYLEPGEHELLVKYRTPGLYEGAAISGITALILLFVWFKRRRNCPAR